MQKMQHNLETKSLEITGMHCASCASVIKRKVEKIDGVSQCAVNYATEKAKVSFDPNKVSVQRMNSEIDQLGYSFVDTQMDTSLHAGHDMSGSKKEELEKLRQQVLVVIPMVIISSVVMAWEIGADSLNLFPKMPDILMTFFHHLLPIFATYVLFIIGMPYLNGVVRFMKHRVANMDTLVGIGTSVAFLYSFIISAFENVLMPYMNTQQSYYDVTIVVIGFITLGKYLEARSKIKTGEAIKKLLGLQAKNALVLRDGTELELPIDQVVVGDILIVKPGSKIPLDGEIIAGKTSIDESMITGEPIPVDKEIGDGVIGATINKQGSIQVKVTKVGDDTMLSQIIKMVQDAQGSKAPIEKLVDQVSAVFVPIVLVFAVVVLLLWLLIGSQFMPLSQAVTLGIVSFVGILVIACPCAMGLATPTAIIVGVGRAAQSGILIKNAESLEKLSAVNFVVLDKTGTITQGTPVVTDIQPVGDNTKTAVLQTVASLENLSEHPLAVAIVAKAKEKNLNLSTVTNFTAIEGKGLRGTIEKQEYFAGNLKLVSDLKLTIDEKIIKLFASQGKTPIVVMTKKEVLAYIAIADKVKDDAALAIAQLHTMGIKVAMLTGDNEITAGYIAKLVGIDRVIAEVLPADKANEIQKLEKEGYVVAMVGDGINDAPALATATVGIAMGTGTDVAIESAGMTLLGGHTAKLPQAVKLSRITMRVIRQNLFWAFFYNVVGIPIAAGVLYPSFGILLSPIVAGGAMAFSSVSVVLNALRLKAVKL